jgi:hypothetical protein
MPFSWCRSGFYDRDRVGLIGVNNYMVGSRAVRQGERPTVWARSWGPRGD